MANPILQTLNGMRNLNGIMQMVGQIKNGNPDAIFQQMIQSNPQFKSFVDANNGKSPEEIARANGVDLGMLKSLIR